MNDDTRLMVYGRQFFMYGDAPSNLVLLVTKMPVEQVWFGPDGQLYKGGKRLTTSPRREALRPRIVYP